MTFLPIVERELRVSARRSWTYWTRAAAAAVAIVLFLGVVVLAQLSKSSLTGQIGPVLFAIFSWLSFIFTAVAGIFLTADCLSEEKREGTLGLLFLTDLRGHDVALGKLLANSLHGFFGLLAVFPVVGLALLMGGVTGAEFWRLVLALCNTLFFSLTLGLWISSRSRDAQKAMYATAALLGLCFVLFPVIDWWAAGWKQSAFEPRFSLASPGFTFSEVADSRSGHFGISLAVTHAFAWLFLFLACWQTPRHWQEKSATTADGVNAKAHRRRFGSPEKRAALRAKLLATNPVHWLAARDRWLGRFQWLFLLGVLALFAFFCASIGELQYWLGAAQVVSFLLGVALNLWLASHASRFFVDGVRNGTLELLLITPLRPGQIVRGHAAALWRLFFLPAVVLLLLNLGAQVAQIIQLHSTLAKSNAGGMDAILVQQIISLAIVPIAFVTGLFALGWFGMWMGLTSRKANVAVIKTLVFVKVIPSIALMFLQTLLMIAIGFGGRLPYWISTAVVGVLSIGANIVFIVIAQRKLLGQFHETVLQATGTVAIPRPPPAVASAPPVLAS